MSNMQINRTVPIPGSDFVWNEFKRSLPMSTYLVAFLISNFTTHSTVIPQITRVWSRRSILRNTSYAAYIAPKALKFYENYFGVRYPLNKLDLVTLPSYPVPGMENFGLIITKEDSLATKNKGSQKEWVATVTAHEIAHQWAGDLVTPQSWSQSWLSEGFASYFAAKSLDKVEPQLEATNHMMVDHVRIVMIGDEELHLGQTLEIKHFDPLVQDTKNIHIYYKGAAVLRMLNSVLGEDLFAKGIKNYFRKYRFKCVTERDFYDIFTTGNFSFVKDDLPTSINNIMKGWTTQESYPLLTVNRLDNGTISIRQDIFTEKKNESRNSALNDVRVSSTWWIPISYYTSKDSNFSTSPKAWYPPTHEPLLLNENVLPGSWIVLNSQQSCYLRVNYDNDLWDAISKQLILDHTKIHLLNRAQLFMDAFHLFEKGHIDIDKALGLMRYLGKERNYIPFYTAMRSFSQIEVKMRGNSHYDLLKSFLSSIILPMTEGKFANTYTERKRSQIALSWACLIQIKNATIIAKKLFRKWEEENDFSIFSELAKKSLLCSAVESGSEEEWGVVFRRAFDTETPNEVTSILREALSCSDNKTRIESLLNFIVEGSHTLSYNDAMDMYNYLVRSKRWNELTWNHLNEQFNNLMMRYDFIPIPFVVTPRDLEKFLTILKKFDPCEKDLFQSYVEENIKFAAEGGRTISQVTKWLVKMAPFEAPK
ncbi:Aminopeptidase Ey [Armadillidium nasatum]|uniref:Aminopeptidase Ey n=1 Tax=Armadillidium nasatum TaxID=96803 RepID=A0A5N5SVT1_9CRUS|nr:Aminopeptidase Ey [Armadillidium nasatum]